MPAFEYQALDAAGKLLSGTMEAETRAEVMAQLDRSGWTPIAAKPKAVSAGRSWRDLLTPEPRPEDITAMTLDLAMLLKGGVALNEALAILIQMEGKGWLVAVLRELNVALSHGKSFSQALGGTRGCSRRST
ncbi:type II secretion system F family protein [Methylorubrum suomiense]